jgi:predicted amidohydrolase YtcJ
MGLANSAALKIAGVDRKVKDVEGGTIVRNEAGELTGIFKDNAMDYIFNRIPSASDEQIDKALLAAMNYFASNGVTSVQAVDAASYADAIERVRKNGKLITRVYIMETISRWEKLKKQVARDGRGDNWMKTGGLKGFVDGSLGSHTAAFLEPYTDLKTDSGLTVNSEEDLYTWISNADR